MEKPFRCLVLDIDETLLHTETGRQELEASRIFSDPSLIDIRRRAYVAEIQDATGPRGRGEVTLIWGVTRPHLREFLDFVFEHFALVGVWSAGRKNYVDRVVDLIFRDAPEEPHFVYTWDDCDKTGGSTSKPLTRLFNDFRQCNEKNTLMLDDNATVFRATVGNGVLIPPYTPVPTPEALRREDRALLQFRDWLLRPEVMSASDVRVLDKRGIFSS